MTRPHLAPLMSSSKDDWCTPPELLELIRLALGPIGLDPCGHPSALVHPTVEWRVVLGQDGLTPSWAGYGLVYVNPPYGRDIAPWTAKMAREGSRGVEIVALITARTDTNWWHDNILATATAVCCLKGRLTFLGAPNPAPFPSALVYWGPQVERFVAAFADLGWVVVL